MRVETMKIPNIIPPSDLLQRIDGVEDGLRKRRRLGLVGLLGMVASAGQVVISAYNSDWLAQLRAFGWQELLADWHVLLGLFVLIASTLLVVWARFWLHESRRPFKYTYHIEQFQPVNQQANDPYLAFLAPDLSERLSDRIMRLSRFDESNAPSEALEQRRSHLHIEGYYLVRLDADRRWVVEVTPWVRLGGASSRQTLALPVKAPIGKAKRDDSVVQSEAESQVAPLQERSQGSPLTAPSDDYSESEQPGGSDASVDRAGGPPELSTEQYETILERVYFSIATEVYKQIRHDVQRKIDLLPTRYFRAVAYHNEAMDYARSNTLDAYEVARELFDAAIGMYDPSWTPASPSRLRRVLLFFGRKLPFWIGRRIRRAVSRVVPRVGRLDVMIARAKLGYADMILYRHILAGMSGQTLSSIFEARPVAHRAVDGLYQTAVDVPGRRQALFDGFVTLASIYFYLDSIGVEVFADPDPPVGRSGRDGVGRRWLRERRQLHPSAWSYLNKARQLDPIRLDHDAHYQFVFGKLQPEIRWELRFLRRAFELDRKFEAAQFELALRSEMQWRSRDTLEPAVADLVIMEYKHVLRLNPGNISALGRLGDMYWLLARVVGPSREAEYRQLAKDAFGRGRESKLIRQDTFVAELDYGLARLAAEDGDFQRAYHHYMSATSAHVAYGVAHARGGYTAQFHFFDRIGDQILDRYRQYFETVQSKQKLEGASDRRVILDRVQQVVFGLACNDYGEACLKYWLRHGDDTKLKEASELFEQAYSLVEEESVFPAYNAYLLERYRDDFQPAAEWISKVERLEPKWSDAQLAKRAIYTSWALRADSVIKKLNSQIDTLCEDLRRLEKRRDNWLHPNSPPIVVHVTVADDAGLNITPSTQQRRTRLGAVPDSSADADADKAYATLVREIAQIERELTELETRCAMQLQLREHALDQVSGGPRREVPHEWLVTVWNRPTHSELSRLYRESKRDWLRWERELNDVHVRMLISWVNSLILIRRNQRSNAANNTDQQGFGQSFLEWLQQHFWPDDPDVLAGLYRVAIDHRRREECSQRLWLGFCRELQEDPRFITVWRALFDEASTDDTRQKVLKELSSLRRVGMPGFSAAVWLQWGDKLQHLEGDKPAAVMAYKQALAIDRQRLSREDASVFVKLGDRLADLGQWPDSESAYALAKELETRAA